MLQAHGARVVLASCAALLALSGSAGLAHAGTIYPTNTGDVGTGSGTCSYANPPSGTGCSLREAIAFANAGDTISLAAPAPAGPYKLSLAELDIGKDLTLAGAGRAATTIQQTDGHDRVLAVQGSPTVIISGLTITGGSVTGRPGANGADASTAGANGADARPDCMSGGPCAGHGGGIYNESGALTLSGVVVTGNSANGGKGGHGGNGHGGALKAFGTGGAGGNGGTGAPGGGAFGGGIFNAYGVLTLSDVTVSGNSSRGGDGGRGGKGGGGGGGATGSGVGGDGGPAGDGGLGRGGGIYNFVDGALTLRRATLSANGASGGTGGDGGGGGTGSPNGSGKPGGTGGDGHGGGGYIDTSVRSLAAVNSTISGNTAAGGGGGPGAGGNSAGAPGRGYGGGLSLDAGGLATMTMTLGNVTIAANDASTSAGGTETIGAGSFAFQNSIVAANGDGPFDPDAALANARLRPLADNGGPTFTHALLAGSPAIDGGNPSGCTDPTDSNAPLTVDQRGATRPQNGRCDSGAFELVAPPVNAVPPVISGTPRIGRRQTCATGTWSGGTPQTYSFAWLRDGVLLRGATGAAYTARVADASHALRCRVTASNFGGSVSAQSAPVTIVPPPRCTLRPRSSKIGLTRALAAAKVMPKRKRAVLKLTARCDQGAAVRLTGAIKVTPKKNGTSKPKTKTITLSAVRASAKANVPLTLAMKLPKAVLTALARGAHESARFTLTATNANGTGRAIAKIAGLVKK